MRVTRLGFTDLNLANAAEFLDHDPESAEAAMRVLAYARSSVRALASHGKLSNCPAALLIFLRASMRVSCEPVVCECVVRHAHCSVHQAIERMSEVGSVSVCLWDMWARVGEASYGSRRR